MAAMAKIYAAGFFVVLFCFDEMLVAKPKGR